MRYYEFSVKINEDEITRTVKRDIGYVENVLTSMNHYLYKHSLNSIYSFAYRKEGNRVDIALCFDEKQSPLETIMQNMDSVLSELDSSYEIVESLIEITRFQYKEDMDESKRREYLVSRLKMIEFSGLDLLEYDDDRRTYMRLSESLIPEVKPVIHNIYDQSLKTEVATIASLNDSVANTINLAHYVISAKSIDTIKDIAGILAQNLYDNKRLSSKRIEIIQNISPLLYKKHYFEALIEGSYGSTIIIDMTTNMNDTSANYVQASEYIANVVKRHKNNCLFIFAHVNDTPSFSYQIITRLQKNIKLVPIREGYGDRKSACAYLKSLIKSSNLSEYANLCNEYMKTLPSRRLSQSEVWDAVGSFEAWCINQTTNAYSSMSSSDFLLGQTESVSSPSKELEKMIGLREVKKQIKEIIAANIVDRERVLRRGSDYVPRTMHMIFAGNPGTAKTTVAKLFGQIAKENNLLKSGIFVEKSGTNLFAAGDNSIPNAFEEAKGGILFIDEAYAIISQATITSLIQEMENHRDEVITIFAGYNDAMKSFLKRNDGLKSRIPYWVDFPDYSVDELVKIFKLMLNERGFVTSPKCLKVAYNAFEKAAVMDNFGNGRYVRNYLDEIIKRQSTRIYSGDKPLDKLSETKLFTLEAVDFDCSPAKEDETNADNRSAREQFDSMIGLESAKQLLNKALASFKLKKVYNELGLSSDTPNMHMVFTGNPGTAKTTTARLFAQILKDEGVLSSGTFVELGRADLVGKFVGHTAPLVKEQFKKAQGGVLFIDEAYSLSDSSDSFGDEAINTIVQEMENHREDVIVIFAGYPEPMAAFLEKNPGMQSRIAFNINFEDYTADELREITILMLNNKHMKISGAAMDKLYRIYSGLSHDTTFGNGRFVRQIIEEAYMNLAERLMSNDISSLGKEFLTTLEAEDIPDRDTSKSSKTKMGFAA